MAARNDKATRFKPGHKEAVGGVRPNAGPKTAFELAERQDALDRQQEFKVRIGKKTHTMTTTPAGLAMFVCLEAICGRGTKNQYTAAKDMLDRRWGKAKQQIEINGGDAPIEHIHRLESVHRSILAKQTTLADSPPQLGPPAMPAVIEGTAKEIDS